MQLESSDMCARILRPPLWLAMAFIGQFFQNIEGCCALPYRWQYTENEEDSMVSVIDLPGRMLLGKIKTPRPLAGIAISADGACCRGR